MPPAALCHALAAARATYPGVCVADDAFYASVAQRLGTTPLEALRTSELFLACGCACRDRIAIAYLERDTFGEVEAAYRRFPRIGITLDDVKQRLRELLILRNPPAIAGYAGTGSLRGWVRAAALHMLLNIAERETREQPTDDRLFDVMLGSDASAEASYMKLTCRAELEAALSTAMDKLGDRARCLLRLAFVDGRNVDEIGAIYGVHRATAARWVADARRELVDATRADLMQRLEISATDAGSIITAALSGVGSMLIARLTRSAGPVEERLARARHANDQMARHAAR